MPDQTTLQPDEVMLGSADGPGVWIAPVGTAYPTDATTAFAAGWSTLGYVSEDGVTLSRSTDSEDLYAWQSKAPLRTVMTSVSLTLQFTLLEISARNLALYFGEATPADADAYEIEVRSDTPVQEWAIAIATADGDSVQRIIFPRATLSENGDIELKAAELSGLEVTLSALDTDGLMAVVQRGTKTTQVTSRKQATKALTDAASNG